VKARQTALLPDAFCLTVTDNVAGKGQQRDREIKEDATGTVVEPKMFSILTNASFKSFLFLFEEVAFLMK